MDTEPTYSIEQCIDYIGMGKFQWRVLLILGLCTMSDGVQLMLITVLGPALQCTWPEINDVQIALLSTVIFTGMMFGAFLFGILADKYGRQKVIFGCAVLNVVFGVAAGFAPSYYWLLLFQLVIGAGVAGTTQSGTLLYEFSPSNKRGLLYVFCQLFWVVSSVYVYGTAIFTVARHGWRLLVIICAIPQLIVAVAIYFTSESPRYYMAVGKQEEAERVLKKIATVNGRPLPPGRLVDAYAQEECGSVKQLFHESLLRATLLLGYMCIAISLAYYGLILFYSTFLTIEYPEIPVIESSTTANSTTCETLSTQDYLSLLVTSFADLGGLPLLTLMLWRLRRRIICIVNYSVGAFLLGLFLVIPNHQPTVIGALTFITRMFLNNQFVFMELYTMEVYPTSVRAAALGGGIGLSRLGAMIAPFVGQLLIKYSFDGAIGILTGATALAALCSYFQPIETHGQPLRQTIHDATSLPLATSRGFTSLDVVGLDDMTSLIKADNDGVDRGYDSLTEGKPQVPSTP